MIWSLMRRHCGEIDLSQSREYLKDRFGRAEELVLSNYI